MILSWVSILPTTQTATVDVNEGWQRPFVAGVIDAYRNASRGPFDDAVDDLVNFRCIGAPVSAPGGVESPCFGYVQFVYLAGAGSDLGLLLQDAKHLWVQALLEVGHRHIHPFEPVSPERQPYCAPPHLPSAGPGARGEPSGPDPPVPVGVYTSDALSSRPHQGARQFCLCCLVSPDFSSVIDETI